MKTRRTTLILEEGLYKQAKRLALDQDKHFKDVVREALQVYIARGPAALSEHDLPPHRAWSLGIRGTMSRREIYRDYMKGPTYRRGD